uniref:Serine/threonine-protein phosphatase 2A activator n=1 Tax=Hirondellea gigas TaxID=1518452 RepID=A0A6A7G5D3_9CRUS
MKRILSDELIARNASSEITPYLLASFGDLQRIDYGTGHELGFIFFLCSLREIGVFTKEDGTALVFKVFVRYLKLMRAVQSTYLLEPAGSRGVWGLDDYQFLPFIFGSSQLIGHPHIKPRSVTEQDILDTFSEEYMYLACVRFIMKLKTGHFGEHSPILYDISGVAFWKKVNSGLIKMYHDDVFQKFPVAQHFLFGSIMSFDERRQLPAHDQRQSNLSQSSGSRKTVNVKSDDS